MLRKITCNRMRKLIAIKEKVSLYSNQITFSYNQWCHRLHLGSTQKHTVQAVSSKKKTSGRKKKTKTRWKIGEEGKRDGRSLCEIGRNRCGRKEELKNGRMRCGKKRKKEGRENEGEGERDERRGRERRTENRESGTRNVLPFTGTFPSTKLGNNMIPIKGRLGKNTTPTGKDPTKLNQNLQANPLQRQPSLEVSSRANLIYTPGKAESPKYGLQSNRTAIYKKAKAHENSRSRFQFSMNQHYKHSNLPKRLEVERPQHPEPSSSL